MTESPTVQKFQINGTETGRVVLPNSVVTEVPRVPSTGWMNCTECHQSATGQYAGGIACLRCGWNQYGRRRHQHT